MDSWSRARARLSEADPEAEAEWLRGELRALRISATALALRAHAGDGAARLALASPEPPAGLREWVDGLAALEHRAWAGAALVAGGLCAAALGRWPAGVGAVRGVEAALLAAAARALGRPEPVLAEALAEAAGRDVEDLRQLIESIRIEHRLSFGGGAEPRALSCGLAAVDAARAALRALAGEAAPGERGAPGEAVAECARALGSEEPLRLALGRGALAAAGRWGSPPRSSRD